MTTKKNKKPHISEVSHKALASAADSAESRTYIERFFTDEDAEMVRLRVSLKNNLTRNGLCFEAASPTLLVSEMIDALVVQELIIERLQAQIAT